MTESARVRLIDVKRDRAAVCLLREKKRSSFSFAVVGNAEHLVVKEDGEEDFREGFIQDQQGR